MLRDAARMTAALILDKKIPVADVARRCGTNERAIVRFLADVTREGYTALQWDEVRRIQRAAFDAGGVSGAQVRTGRVPVLTRCTLKAADPAWRERRIRELEGRP